MTLVVGPTPKLVTQSPYQPPGCTATCSAWTGERSAGVRKLFRLIQHLDALLLSGAWRKSQRR
jgi:hypothetical protein